MNISSSYGCWPKSWKINQIDNKKNALETKISGLDGKSNDVLTEEIIFPVIKEK